MPQTRLQRFIVNYADKREYHSLKREIFHHQVYDFESSRPDPLIIDIGAHIGLSVLYFKLHYPAAEIIAYEPHPSSFALLEANIFENNLPKVTAKQLAVAAETGPLTLYADADNEWLSTTSALEHGWTGDEETHPLQVEAISLPEALATDRAIDLVKLDVEGLEAALILSTANATIKSVREWLIELHPNRSQKEKLLAFFEELGYRVTIEKNGRVVTDSRGGLQILRAVRD